MQNFKFPPVFDNINQRVLLNLQVLLLVVVLSNKPLSADSITIPIRIDGDTPRFRLSGSTNPEDFMFLPEEVEPKIYTHIGDDPNTLATSIIGINPALFISLDLDTAYLIYPTDKLSDYLILGETYKYHNVRYSFNYPDILVVLEVAGAKTLSIVTAEDEIPVSNLTINDMTASELSEQYAQFSRTEP